MMINVYARNFGWLFEDLERDIASIADDVIASEEPLPDADAWICIRTDEAKNCPDLSRCVVQVHDFRERHVDYNPGAVSRVHPDCCLWTPAVGKPPEILMQPIGARRLFTLRESMPERFTVGWVGRDVLHEGRHIKRPQLFVDAVLEARRQGCEVRASIYGDRGMAKYGEPLAENGALKLQAFDRDRRESLRDFYHSIDALVVTCEPEPGPLSVYEALACGVPVIAPVESSFPGCDGVWWYRVGLTPHTPRHKNFSNAICGFGIDRTEAFEHREQIRASVTHWQDDWAKAQVELARGLC